jgi:hypothetical protein
LRMAAMVMKITPSQDCTKLGVASMTCRGSDYMRHTLRRINLQRAVFTV